MGSHSQNAGVYQCVPVEPHKRYRFDGYIKAEDVFSRSGLPFLVKDAQDGTQYILGEDVMGTTYWRASAGSFTAGASTHLLMVSLIREQPPATLRGRSG